MGSSESGIVVSTYKIGQPLAVDSGCKNLSNSVVAEKASCITGTSVVDTQIDSLQQAIVTPQTQESAWSSFRNDPSVQHPQEKDFGPTEGNFFTVWTPTVDENLDKAFVARRKTVMLMAEYAWKDGMGQHTNDYCVWLQNIPGLFTPGAISKNAAIVWHSCEKHDGVKK
jgi:hypothetical protein